jgi:iron complex transport system substrate-binding protein
LAKGLPIYNNTLRTNSEGGNDFWESGAVRPDLVLEDLVKIFASEPGKLHYYLELR